jgi:hypothetical protein
MVRNGALCRVWVISPVMPLEVIVAFAGSSASITEPITRGSMRSLYAVIAERAFTRRMTRSAAAPATGIG